MWKKHIKNGKKSDFKEIFLNWQQMGKVIRNFCWHQNFVPKGMSVCALGLYTCIKSFKMCLKSYFKEIVLKLATNGQSDKGFLLTSTFVPKGLSAPALGLYTCIKALKYIPGPCVRWAFTGPLVLWFVKKYSVRLLSEMLVSNHLVENDVKKWYRDVNSWHHYVKKKTWRHARESS